MRTTTNQYNEAGQLINGFDYENQVWVIDGKIKLLPSQQGRNGHHRDCDDQGDTQHNFMCSALCPLA